MPHGGSKLVKKLAIHFLLLLSLLIPSVKPISATPERVGNLQPAIHYYVDAIHGSDLTGNGSLSSPWKTVTYALSQVTGPDVEIHIAAGTYNTVLGETFPLTINTKVSLTGSDRNEVVISGQNDRSVIYLNGSASDIFAGTILSNITVQNGSIGLQIYATQSHTVVPSIINSRLRWNTTGIQMSTSDTYHNGATITGLISNTEVISSSQTGIYMRSYGYSSPSNVSPLIINSRVAGNGSYGLYIQGSAVSSNGSTAAPRIVSSQIVNNGSHGIFAEGTYEGWSNPKIERSWIGDNQGYGFYWAQGVNRGNINASIINTIIVSNHGGGIYLDQRSEYGSGTRMLRLINSTVTKNGNYGIYWQRTSPYPYLDVTPQVINTILWNPAADDLYSTGATWTTTEIQYSDIEDGDLAGQSGNFAQNPLFVDAAHNNFDLTIGSPVINVGDNVNCPSPDYRGLSRPQNGFCEIGAFETVLVFIPIILK